MGGNGQYGSNYRNLPGIVKGDNMRGYLLDKWRSFLEKLAKVHKSFHMWVNGTIGSCVVIFPYIQDYLPLLKPYLCEKTYLNVMLVIVIINMIFNFRKL